MGSIGPAFLLIICFFSMLSTCLCCWKPLSAQDEPLQTDSLAQANDPFGCSPAEASRQRSLFAQSWTKNRHVSACAPHWWLQQVAEVSLKGRRKAAIADVGCNKAYFSAAALNYLAPDYGNHLQLLFKQHQQRGIYPRPCGACGECEQAPIRVPPESQQSVQVLCFEPSEIHVASLTTARDATYGSPSKAVSARSGKTPINFHIRQAAVANYTGTARFPTNCRGNTCSLGDKMRANFTTVNVTSVDDEMKHSNIEFFDVLKIDAEGFDPLVLAGAYNSLKHHRIGVVSFEYHKLWARSRASLRQCVSYLDELGYVCFFDGTLLAKLSGSCWMNSYEMRKWMNVVCAVRGSPMERELMAGSFIASKVKPDVAPIVTG